MNEFCASQGSGAVTFFRCGGQKWTNTYHLCQISPGFRVAYFDRNFFFKIIRWRFREQYHLLLPMFRGLCIVFVCVCWAHWWSCWAQLWFPQKVWTDRSVAWVVKSGWPKNAPSRGGTGPHLIHCSLGSPKCPPNGVSIGSTVLQGSRPYLTERYMQTSWTTERHFIYIAVSLNYALSASDTA